MIQPASREVFPGIIHISLPVPFKVEPVNVYFLAGEIPTIIDTGVGTERTFEWLDKELRTFGFAAKEIRQVILTHGHIDHSGLSGKIHRLTGSPVLLHASEWKEMKQVQYPTAENLKDQFRAFRSWGLAADQVKQFDSMRQALNKLGTLPLEGIRLLNEGDVIQAGDHLLKPIFCPGHSAGSLCYYLTAGKVLFCGDHILARISPNPCVVLDKKGMAQSGLPMYIDSLDRLANYDVRMCLTGHGNSLSDLPGRIAAIKREHAERQQRFLAYLGEAGPCDLLQLTRVFLADLGKDRVEDLFLGMREAFGQVSLLEQKNLIQSEDVAGVRQYSLQ